MLVCAGGLLGLTAGSALAAIPPVLDRVPDNALFVIAMPSADAVHKNVSALMTAVEFPFPVPEVNDMLAMAGITGGIDLTKSMAIVGYAPKKAETKKDADKPKDAADKPKADADKDEGDDEDADAPKEQFIALLPITKYDELLANFGAKPGAAGAIDKVAMPTGDDGFFKDIGNGYVAMSDDQALLTGFDARTGPAALKSKLGKAGESVADNSDVFTILNVDVARPMWPELRKKMEDKVKEGADAMPMGAATNPFENPAVTWFLDTAVNETRAVVVGLKTGNKGIGFDVAVNFKDGSTMGKMFAGGGRTGDLLTKLPGGSYLMAAAFDYSNAEFKRFAKDLISKSAKPGVDSVMSGKTLDASDGVSMVMGLPKGGVFGGIMTGIVQYVKTKDTAAYITAMKEDMTRVNGKTVEGMTYQTTFTEKGAQVDGRDVDVWDMKITPDGTNQMAVQGLGMVFGPTGGPSGYLAKADNGLYLTFSKSSDLMSQALKAGKGEGETLGNDKLISQVAKSLPGDRLGEVYIGTKGILDLLLPLAPMAGIQVPAEKIPETLPPLAMALSGESGSAHFAFFVPAPVIKTVVQLGMAVQEQMNGGGPGAAPGAAPGNGGKGQTGQPRF
jgi:hypothetical protein